MAAVVAAGGCRAHEPVPGPRTERANEPARPADTATAAAAPEPRQRVDDTAPVYGGSGIAWPATARTSPRPPVLGAVVTTARVALAGGGTLPAGLTLPRVGGTPGAPDVLSPCAHQVTLAGPEFRLLPPRSAGELLVVLDPGHGGHESGAVAPDGTRESSRVLELAGAVGDSLAGRVDRVVLTRVTDTDTSLAFRVALADALDASLALSVHLNNGADGESPVPGTEVFGATSDPGGRRVAGVLYQAERRYLDAFTSQVGGRWAANRDAGALYRLGSRGDYYYLLRNSHVTWAISESVYLSRAEEAALIARADVRAGLATAIADGVVALSRTSESGSGWRVPIQRPADPDPPPAQQVCTDPT
ncbi:MAG: N-acetylmuramoyl-L-alanine amidase [Actinomycetota bacterium]|nr:N-acetylmuramoyl-L-alanine amidase [Actinomycetota bacterium]